MKMEPKIKRIPWNKGMKNHYRWGHHTKETREKISQNKERAKKISISNLGREVTEKTREKISLANKGRKRTEEVRKKISLANKGLIPWNKGRKMDNIQYKKAWDTRRRNGTDKHTEEYKNIMSKRMKGEENPNYGKKFTPEHRRKLSEKAKIRIREKSSNWQGGISFEPYTSEFNTKLKNEIRKRDNQVCMNCGIHREKLNEALHIHHINYDKKCNLEQNLISLCRKCHMITNYNRKDWMRLFQGKLSKLYGYQYSEDGKIILNLNQEKCLI